MIDHSRRVRWTQVKRKGEKKDGVGGADVLEINSPQETGILGAVFGEASKPDGKRALFLEDATAHPANSDEERPARGDRSTGYDCCVGDPVEPDALFEHG